MRGNKTLALLLCALLFASVPSGFGSTVLASEPTTTISIFTTRVTPDQKSEAMVRLQERLGVKLDVTSVPDADYNTKLNLFIASSDLPDVYGAAPNGDQNAMRAAASITVDEIQEYAPDIYSLFATRAEQVGLSIDKLLARWTVDGSLRGFHTGKLNNALPYGIMIRTDVLEELSFDMPKTIGDWDALLRAYQAAYPGSYPLTCMNGGDTQAFYMFLAAYGLRRDEWILRDDSLIYAPFQPEMRDALLQFKAWYDAGLVNPEYFSMYADNSAPRTELFNGNTFFYQYYNTNLQMEPPFNEGSIASQVAANFPDATFGWAPIPTLDDGGIKPVVANADLFGGTIVSLGGHLNNDRDKIHTILSAFNMLSADEEAYLLSRYGVEGLHYDMVDGVPVNHAEYSSNEARSEAGFGWLVMVDVDGQDELVEKFRPEYHKKQYAELIEDPDGLYGRNTVSYIDTPRVNGPLNAPDGENLDVLNQAYLTQWNTMFTAVIVGQSSIEQFDAFIAEWKQAVGDAMVEAANRDYLPQYLN
jgi:ABC-type glycerol-3-phosphate transport system substrate-binding protein